MRILFLILVFNMAYAGEREHYNDEVNLNYWGTSNQCYKTAVDKQRIFKTLGYQCNIWRVRKAGMGTSSHAIVCCDDNRMCYDDGQKRNFGIRPYSDIERGFSVMDRNYFEGTRLSRHYFKRVK